MKRFLKPIVCLLLIFSVAMTFTACDKEEIIEREVKTIETEGVEYTIFEAVDPEGAVTGTFAKVTGYIGAEKNITIPTTVTDEDIPVKIIANLSFYDTDINSIIIEEGIETIENFAFGYSKLGWVDLPSTIKSIGDYAFINCNSLSEVNIAAEEKPTLGVYAFKVYNKSEKAYEIWSQLEINVPSSAFDDYYTDDVLDNWSEYQDYLEEVNYD